MNILELRDRVLMLSVYEQKLEHLQKDILRATREVSRLLRQYEKESRDVERIQNNTLSSFIFKLIRKYEDKLEKEQKEEIDAKLAYDRATIHFENLEREKNELTASISSLKVDMDAYQSELADRRSELAFKKSEMACMKYAELENERSAIVSQITEIEQALSAAVKAELTAQNTRKSLESAKRWSTYDVFRRGGIISHMVKYSHIDKAEQSFHTLSSQLRCLKSELGDVHGFAMPEFNEISSGQRAVDFWFDNIFTDLSVRKKVINNAEQISNLLHNIKTVKSALKSKLKQADAALENNRRSEEELLVAM